MLCIRHWLGVKDLEINQEFLLRARSEMSTEYSPFCSNVPKALMREVGLKTSLSNWQMRRLRPRADTA